MTNPFALAALVAVALVATGCKTTEADSGAPSAQATRWRGSRAGVNGTSPPRT